MDYKQEIPVAGRPRLRARMIVRTKCSNLVAIPVVHCDRTERIETSPQTFAAASGFLACQTCTDTAVPLGGATTTMVIFPKASASQKSSMSMPVNQHWPLPASPRRTAFVLCVSFTFFSLFVFVQYILCCRDLFIDSAQPALSAWVNSGGRHSLYSISPARQYNRNPLD